MTSPNNDLTSSTTITTERLERVRDILANLKEDAQKAYGDGDAYMLGVYKELLNVCSPIVVKAIARVERESRAGFNKAHKGLKEVERAKRNANTTA